MWHINQEQSGFWPCWINICISGVATENIIRFLLNWVHFSCWSCLIFNLYHSFWVCHNFLGLIGKERSEGAGGNKFVPRLYYRWYLDNDTPNSDNGINDNDLDENHINENNENNDHNHHNNHNYDDND